jgi:transposase-like protein
MSETTFENAKVGLKRGSGFVNSQGYRMIYRPENNDCDANGYVRFHRYKYSLCNKTIITKNDVIHHVDGFKLNNMKCNLIKINKKEHDLIEDNKKHKEVKRLSRHLYMNGMQLTKIGKIVGRSRNSVSNYVTDLIPIRRDIFKLSILKLRNKGLSYCSIEKVLNKSVSTVYYAVNER